MADQATVLEFHKAFNLAIGKHPGCPTRDLTELRLDLLSEEYEEYLEAALTEDLVGVADALADMMYVIYGTAIVYGFDLDAVFAEVHRSNMTKLDETGKPLYRPDGKVLKGPNYEEPQIAGIIFSGA